MYRQLTHNAPRSVHQEQQQGTAAAVALVEREHRRHLTVHKTLNIAVIS
jgi:hypothetical protein